MVIDRDMSGQEVATHTSTAFGAWSSPGPTRATTCFICKVQGDPPTYTSGPIPSTGGDVNQTGLHDYTTPTDYLAMGRPDGYDDGYGQVFQGVRSFDPNAGQWTTPDAYAGDVHDPMSQKPFMWNRNNPTTYSDPSGYNAEIWVIAFEIALRPIPAAADGLIQGNNISFSQRSISPNFQDDGKFAKLSVNDLPAGLASGAIKPKDVPVQVVAINGVKYIQNNRSATALAEANIPAKFWNIQNVTNNPSAVADVLKKLKNNKIKPGEVIKATPAQVSER